MTDAESNELAEAIRQLSANVKPSKVPPGKWPAKWVREESFWREMTTRTLSGLLVLYIGANIGVWTGWLVLPKHIAVGLKVVNIVGLVTILVGCLVTAGVLLSAPFPRPGQPYVTLDEAAARVHAKRRKRYRVK